MWLMNRAERENRHWSFGEGFTVAREETLRVLVQMAHHERRPQHDRAVPLECTHIPHWLDVYRNPTFAQRRRDCLGNFLG